MPEPTGDRYEAAGRLFTDRSITTEDDSWRLCHGTVIGQGPIAGIPHGHAWVECPVVMVTLPDAADVEPSAHQYDWLVLDHSCERELRLPRGLYYAIGKIEHVRRYGREEACRFISEFGHWGPWQEVIGEDAPTDTAETT